MMQRVAVLTSGGDAPGMNAAIRSVVRCGIDRGWQVLGVRHGYRGLIDGMFTPLGTRDVGGIIQRGGTILGSARAAEFSDDHVRRGALALLERHEIEGLIVIGGGGSQAGALALATMGLPVVGVASTIDNDLDGVDTALGADTALNVALEAIDRLKVTASSHQRAFLVEVMGHESGYLALMSALAGGAEAVVLPGVDTDLEELARTLRRAYEVGKAHALVVVAEGARQNAEALARYFDEHRARLGFELRVTRLGHVQRGGAPSAFDRVLGTRSGAVAIDCMATRRHDVVVGLCDGTVRARPLTEAVSTVKSLDDGLLELATVLAK
jgi:6-phosphofructokinase 1